MKSDTRFKVANLSKVFTDGDAQGSWIGERLLENVLSTERVEAPPFPRQLQIESSNICNHSCQFCAYTLMTREKKHMDRKLFRRLVAEAYALGSREVGLFSGAEPLTCKWLDEYVAYCRDLGYEYIYISTNGSIGGESRFEALLDAGISSIKFSVNGGDRETYREVHGRDDFDKVVANIRCVSRYRDAVPQNVFLGVSFVGTPTTEHTFGRLQEIVRPFVDEILYYEATNQSGQMPRLPLPPWRDCHLPFNKAHISREGYLKACCNDYENFLAIEDLNKMSLQEAWHSPRFMDLRRRHLDDRLESTLCSNCIRGVTSPPSPLVEPLSSGKWPMNDRNHGAPLPGE